MKTKLSMYRAKRKFGDTPEPSGSKEAAGKRIYVVQKHDASHLHYDFRLEHHGVLLSWAVPKGPSLDPGVKRLAVHVEDHPVEYASFTGEIPKGNYGAGTVEIWDKGTWEPLGDVDAMMQEGALKFTIYGERLHGKWALIRMDDEKNWLLIKEKDDFGIYGDEDKVLDRPAKASKLNGPLAYRSFQPQLATLGESAPIGDEWLHEVKYDGYRIIAWRIQNSVHLVTRRGLDWTKKFPDIAKAIEDYIPDGTGLDGEIVVFSKEGISDFGGLQKWLHEGKGGDAQYVVFDMPYLEGRDITAMPLLDRKEKLRVLIGGLPNESTYWLRYSDHVIGHGKSMAKEACQKGLEGIVSKNIRARYVQARTSSWIKTKCAHQEEFVIGGYTEPGGEREGFGSLLLGQYDANGILRYVGKVGAGFDDGTLASLSREMRKLKAEGSPFGPSGDLSEAKAWVRPHLVAQVRYAERTKSGLLRQPVFLGLREDKEAKDVHPEETMKAMPITISHPERVLFPKSGLTKLDLAQYYEQVADRMLPYVSNRPLAIVRCPDGPAKPCFFQKHRGPGMPESLERDVKGENEPFLCARNEKELLTLVQFGAIEIHTWAGTFDRIEEPDMMTFDLDPGPGVEWKTVIESAEVLAEYLRSFDLKPFAKVSGGKGIHVVVPIKAGSLDWTEFKDFAHAVAVSLEAMIPGQFVTVMAKAKRSHRIFLDYLRNGRGSTAIVPYGVRANEEASVALPIAWDKLRSVKSPRQFTVSNASEWLAEFEDPWKGFFASAVAVNRKQLETIKSH